MLVYFEAISSSRRQPSRGSRCDAGMGGSEKHFWCVST